MGKSESNLYQSMISTTSHDYGCSDRISFASVDILTLSRSHLTLRSPSSISQWGVGGVGRVNEPDHASVPD